MIARPEFVRTDILNKLKAALADPEKLTVDELKALLAESIEIIRTLRDLINLKEDILLEDEPPHGNA